MKYGVVIPTVFDSSVFQECLISLKNTFDGAVVVVEEGSSPHNQTEDFVRNLGFDYIKSLEWTGPDALVQKGIDKLAEVDIIVYSHNDVIFSDKWFVDLKTAWDIAYPTKSIGMLNLSFIQPHSGHELLVEGNYFGFCPDIHQPHRVGRCSVTTSFRRDIFSDGLKLDVGTHLDTEICWNCTRKGLWSCWIENDPVIHMSNHQFGGNDITQAVKTRTIHNYDQIFRNQQRIWLNKYKFDLDYYIEYEFKDIKYENWDEIVSHINALNFKPIQSHLYSIGTEMIDRWPEHQTKLTRYD